MTVPRPPRGAGPAGKRLWRAVQSEYQLDEHEQALLVALVRQVDRLDQLEAMIAAGGLLVTGHGTTKMHPAVVEARQTAKGTDSSPEIFHLTVHRRGGDHMEVSMVTRPDYAALLAELGLPAPA